MVVGIPGSTDCLRLPLGKRKQCVTASHTIQVSSTKYVPEISTLELLGGGKRSKPMLKPIFVSKVKVPSTTGFWAYEGMLEAANPKPTELKTWRFFVRCFALRSCRVECRINAEENLLNWIKLAVSNRCSGSGHHSDEKGASLPTHDRRPT